MGYIVSSFSTIVQVSTLITICASPELEIALWEFDTYLEDTDGPPQLLPVDDILSQACRIRITYRDDREDEDQEPATARKRIWATVGLTKVSSPLSKFTQLSYVPC